MSEICCVRLSNEEKEKLRRHAKTLSYQSQSDFLRELMRRGFQTFELTPKEEHLLFNSAQCVMLLKELIHLLSVNEERSAQIISHAKHSAEEWTNKFKNV